MVQHQFGPYFDKKMFSCFGFLATGGMAWAVFGLVRRKPICNRVWSSVQSPSISITNCPGRKREKSCLVLAKHLSPYAAYDFNMSTSEALAVFDAASWKQMVGQTRLLQAKSG